MDYDNSLDPVVIRTKELQKRMNKVDQKFRIEEEKAEGGKVKMSKSDLKEADDLYDELI